MASPSMVHLTTAGGAFHGRVLAARLGAEGILTELRGGGDGPYPNVGSVEVFVKASQVEMARQILLADAIDAAFDEVEVDLDGEAPSPAEGDACASDAARARRVRLGLAVLAVVVVLALLVAVRAV